MRKPDPSEGYGDLGKGCWLLPTCYLMGIEKVCA